MRDLELQLINANLEVESIQRELDNSLLMRKLKSAQLIKERIEKELAKVLEEEKIEKINIKKAKLESLGYELRSGHECSAYSDNYGDGEDYTYIVVKKSHPVITRITEFSHSATALLQDGSYCECNNFDYDDGFLGKGCDEMTAWEDAIYMFKQKYGELD